MRFRSFISGLSISRFLSLLFSVLRFFSILIHVQLQSILWLILWNFLFLYRLHIHEKKLFSALHSSLFIKSCDFVSTDLTQCLTYSFFYSSQLFSYIPLLVVYIIGAVSKRSNFAAFMHIKSLH